ncbi:hypothetical protein AGDE_13537 [Angomonas deanei]|nr:hypothetical protein AGDE_13537 [Angomonas deanei]|eukprot:EPY22202.1 hypothetical protein AGDE_13537 [Angomonas deanei]
MGSSKGVGNSGSMSRRRSSTKRSSLQADSLLIHSTAEGENANAKNNEKIRQLILCLLLEENKNSRQLYSDITQLCDVYVTSAYSRTSSISGGTRDHLQRKAATLLVPADNGSSPLQVPGSPRGKLNGQSREEINILLDALELAMVATFTIGCFSHCSQYALQRVHGMCVREQDTTAYFNSAQRDLAEVYLFYGDGKSATMVAEDVLSLAERIHGPNSPEAVEATLLLALASISCTEGKRAAEVLPPLHEAVQKGEVTLPAHLQAQIHIAVAYTRPNIGSHQLDRHGLTTDSVVAELNRAHALLRGDGDLAEMDKSFSTVLPSQINNSNNASVNAAEDVLHKAQKSREEKRLRWTPPLPRLCEFESFLVSAGKT